MISYGKIRSAFAWAFPLFLGCLYIVGAHLILHDHQLHTRRAEHEDRKKQAEILTIRARAGFSATLQIESSAREVLKELEAIAFAEPTGIENHLPAVLRKHMHPHILQKCRIWAFNREKDSFRLATAAGLENSKRKAMELAFTALINLREKHSDDSTRRRNEKFISGLFGENSAPEYLAAQRLGVLTPVQFESSPHYLYWQKTGNNGGFMALLPGDFVENTTASLKRLSDKLNDSISKNAFV